jgi:alpha-L-rhamnosidase
MNSFNHYSLGSVCEWLYRHVAGIELDPAEPGFKRILLRPWPDARLGFAKASYHSIRGEIASEWRLAGGRLEWSVRVPANTTARVCVPSEPHTQVTEGGMPLAKAPLVRAARREGRFLACDVPAGEYRFSSVWSG